MPDKISIRPSDMIDSGGAPVDRNMLIKGAKFVIFQYTKKDGSPALKPDGTPARATAAALTLLDDDGNENLQHYSAGDPERFVPSSDGKTLVSVSGAESISKSCNFHILMNALVNAGFPENKLDDDISTLDGLYAYWIGVPEPKRPGLVRTAEQEARTRVIPVPSVIQKLPWEKAKAGTRVPAAGAPKAAEAEGDTLARTIEFVGTIVDETGSATRQDLAARIFTDLAKDPNRDAIAAAMFSPAIQAALLAAGFTVEGETISRA